VTDLMAPAFALRVEGGRLGEDVTRRVLGVRWEHTLDLAACLEVALDDTGHTLSDGKWFAPGNELELYLGYGTELTFVGRGEIMRHLPTYPRDGAPTLRVRAYDRGFRLGLAQTEVTGGRSDRPKRKPGAQAGRVHKGELGRVVGELLDAHGITPLVDPELVGERVTYVQKKGTTDLQFLRALARLWGAELAVEWEPDSTSWVGYFLKPGRRPQTERYTFRWGDGDRTTLLAVELEFGTPEGATDLEAYVWDRAAGEWRALREAKYTAGRSEKAEPGSVAESPALGRHARAGSTVDPITSATRLLLAVRGQSVEVLTRPFQNAAQAQRFALDWWAQHRDAFVSARGLLPGVETLRAGQTHRLEGLGVRHDGDYYLTRVEHRWEPGSGYLVSFDGHKVLTE
jgi:phage protein D